MCMVLLDLHGPARSYAKCEPDTCKTDRDASQNAGVGRVKYKVFCRQSHKHVLTFSLCKVINFKLCFILIY